MVFLTKIRDFQMGLMHPLCAIMVLLCLIYASEGSSPTGIYGMLYAKNNTKIFMYLKEEPPPNNKQIQIQTYVCQ